MKGKYFSIDLDKWETVHNEEVFSLMIVSSDGHHRTSVFSGTKEECLLVSAGYRAVGYTQWKEKEKQ